MDVILLPDSVFDNGQESELECNETGSDARKRIKTNISIKPRLAHVDDSTDSESGIRYGRGKGDIKRAK